MNTLESTSIRSPALKDEECAKFTITDPTVPFIFHDVIQQDKQYTLSFYAKSDSNGTVQVADKTFVITTDWQECIATFTAQGTDLKMYFDTSGTYYIYHAQLEDGNVDTDWTPNPEDVDENIQKALVTADVEYYLSNSATTLSGGKWSSTAPEWVDGKYMWSRTVKIDGKGNKTYSPSETGTCIAGAQGSTGNGVQNITEEYYLSDSATELTGGNWSNTRPTWKNGKYIWTRSVITYTDNTTNTTDAICVTGEKGTAGRVFILEASSSIVKKENENTLNPNYLEFYAYYRDGDDTARTSYAGRFKIEETYDGRTWETIYASTEDEISIKYSLYSFITDENGNTVTTSDDIGIAFSRGAQSIRCSVYKSGGFTDLLDRQEVPIVRNIDTLSQDEIFNMLTNNGEAKGIYKEGNQLYVSFSYARGGKLVLGGANDENGVLEIYDQYNNLHTRFTAGENYFASSNTINGEFYFIVTSFLDVEHEINCLSKNSSHVSKFTSNKIEFLNGYDLSGKIYGKSVDEQPPTDGDFIFSNNDREFLYIVGGDGGTVITSEWEEAEPSWTLDVIGSTRFKDYVLIDGGFEITGTKSRLVKDTAYGDRLLYCYETPTPYFGDIGFGQLDDNGECIVCIDDIFAETVNINMEYAVFLQKEGQGDLWVDVKEATHFTVKGTPNLKFSWELKMAQKGYEQLRLDDEELTKTSVSDGVDLQTIFDKELEEYDREMEELTDESIKSISGY